MAVSEYIKTAWYFIIGLIIFIALVFIAFLFIYNATQITVTSAP
jgi:cell division protein FtsX